MGGAKAGQVYNNTAFPSLLQKGIAMSQKQLGSGDYGAVFEVRQTLTLRLASLRLPQTASSRNLSLPFVNAVYTHQHDRSS
jgi:hypothetical protein